MNYPKRLTSDGQTIQSAGYPGRVPPGSECSWHIVAPEVDQIVHVEFIAFKMNKNCKFHYVKLFSADSCQIENLTKDKEVRLLLFALFIGYLLVIRNFFVAHKIQSFQAITKLANDSLTNS